MTILVLCREDNLCNMLACYAHVLRRRGIQLVCADPSLALNGNLAEWLSLSPEQPSLILHPEADAPFLPRGLAEADIPTACFQVDTYAFTRQRISWSMLFDLVFVFHPGYEERFRKAGHPAAHFIPHAVDASMFLGQELERVYEVGWVGQTYGPMYHARRPILNELSKAFRTNDFTHRYTLEEMAGIYRQSKTVVNIGRDDYPQDANLRSFEAMAGGALLFTSLPSELSGIGFRDGVHFIGYRSVSEIAPLVRRYIADERARCKIAEAAREKVLREHTYDRRVDALLELTVRVDKERSAPARAWAEERVRLTYLDYFAANGALECALAELPAIARRSLAKAAVGVSLLARAWGRQWRGRIKARFLQD